MSVTKRQVPKFLRVSGRPSLSATDEHRVGHYPDVLLIAVFAPVFQSLGVAKSPIESLINPIHEPPSLSHWFGTSRQGYDVFADAVW